MSVMFSPTTSELRRVYGQEPATAGHIPGGAAEVGEPTGEEDSQEASPARALCSLLAPRLHEGPAQPVHEEAQSTAPHQQEQVDKTRDGVGAVFLRGRFVLLWAVLPTEQQVLIAELGETSKF